MKLNDLLVEQISIGLRIFLIKQIRKETFVGVFDRIQINYFCVKFKINVTIIAFKVPLYYLSASSFFSSSSGFGCTISFLATSVVAHGTRQALKSNGSR
jgi:hypothetical protein